MLSLTTHRQYRDALMTGNVQFAEKYKADSRRNATIACVCAAVCVCIGILWGIVIALNY